MSIKEAIQLGTHELKKAGIRTSQLDAEVLLSFILKKPKEWIYANNNFQFSISNFQRYKKLIERRKKHEPIAYITNHKEFYGLDFYVNRNVLIPRPETELLIEQLVNSKQLTDNSKKQIKIVDVGTGSGCIAISLIKEIAKLKSKKEKVKIIATDISEKALRVAKLNAKEHKVLKNIKFLRGDFLDPLTQKTDIVVSNPPYVLNQKITKEVEHEPRIATFGNIKLFEKLVSQIKQKLKNNGVALIEIGKGQKTAIRNLIKKIIPQAKIEFIKDYAGTWRIVKILFR